MGKERLLYYLSVWTVLAFILVQSFNFFFFFLEDIFPLPRADENRPGWDCRRVKVVGMPLQDSKIGGCGLAVPELKLRQQELRES